MIKQLLYKKILTIVVFFDYNFYVLLQPLRIDNKIKLVDINNRVKTMNSIELPPFEDISRRNVGYCWEGKLRWNGSVWQRQIVILYGGNYPPIDPPFDHPIWDYVSNLPVPDFKGTVKNEMLYA